MGARVDGLGAEADDASPDATITVRSWRPGVWLACTGAQAAPGRSPAGIAVGLVEAGIVAHDLRRELEPAPDGRRKPLGRRRVGVVRHGR